MDNKDTVVSKDRENKNIGAPFLSVVIPCYNEEKVIGDTLDTVIDYLKERDYSWEIIVVDDGSTDRTVAIAKERAGKRPEIRVLENKRNIGKGYSVRSGFLESTGRFVCFTDADLSTPIEETQKLLRWMEDSYDIAIGSRGLKDSDVAVHQPWWRELMGKTFNLFVQSVAVKGIKDTQCGFKCFKSEAVKEVFSRQTLDGFSFDVEALYIARKFGYRIKEVPVRWINRFESKVNPVLAPLQMLRDLVRIRIKDLRGEYR